MRSDSPDWIRTKAVGDAAETLLADVLRGIGLAVHQLRGLAAHDLEISGRIEVKADALASRTGRIAVELSHAGHPSGIALASAAGCWVYVLDAEILLIRRDALRAMVQSGPYPTRPAAESNTVALIPLADVRAAGVSIPRRRGVAR